MKRALQIVALAVLLMAAAGAPAQAGTYEVLSCGAAHGINHAWRSFNDDASTLVVGASCAPLSGGPEDGLFAVDRIPGPPNAPQGRGAGWRLTAPAGTRITRLTAQFYLGQNSAGEWFPFLRTSGQVLETCQPPGGDPECERGVDVYDPLGPMWSYALNTSMLEAGVRCAETTGACGNGALLHAAWAALYSTRVQITDTVPPTVSGSLPALDPSGYLHGAQTLTVAASDGSGIRGTRLEVDGSTLSSSVRACDYTYVAPCSNEPGAALVLDTRRLADGAHTVGEVAEDAAGNVAARTFGITVDNTAPASPRKVAVRHPGSGSSTSPVPQLRWTNPPGQVAPIAAAHWSVCRPDTTSRCLTGSRRSDVGGGVRQTGRLGPPLENGEWEARLWLEDAAGNADAAKAAGPLRIVVSRNGRLHPRLKLLRVRRRGNVLSVRGTAAARFGRVIVAVERKLQGRTHRARGRATIRRGRWTKRLRLRGRLAKARRVTLAVRFTAQDGYRAQTLRRRVRR